MDVVRLILSLLVACATGVALRAQSAQWDPPSGSLPVGQTTALQLVFDNCSPKSDPVPPKVDGLILQLQGRASNTSIINGRYSVSQSFTFAAALTRDQRVEIPVFEVETDKGVVRIPSARFEPTSATIGRSGTPLASVASARLAVNPSSVWAGEVFDLTATVSASRAYFPQFTNGFDWTADPLLAEPWSDPQQSDSGNAAEPLRTITYRSRAVARSPGRFNVNAATHVLGLSVGISGFGFFQQRQYDQYTITSNTPTIEVRPLPPAPAGFNGAVGQLKLVSKVVPENAAVGEPVTWTLELTGTANWPDIPGLPAREVSNDFQVVQPKAKRTPADNKIFDATLTEDVVLVPTKAGTYTLGPLSFVCFDPKSGSYKTLTTPRTTLTVTPPAAPQFGPAPSSGSASSPSAKTGGTGTAANAEPPAPPAPPAGIPRDPLPGADEVLRPFGMPVWIASIAAPFGGLVILWFVLALREARRTDPLRPQREARARLAALLARLRTASHAQRAALLLEWQRDTAFLWQIPHAAPPATALADADWAALWTEADRALYGANVSLPSDWIARAEAALAAKTVPAFKVSRLFRPRNLFPFAALVAFGMFLLVSGHAADGVSLYRAGDVAAAAKIWSTTVAQHPTDWIARHNLSLALAQEDRVGEAAGQASAAFVQHPSNPSVQWHFALACEKAGFAPTDLATFLNPGLAPEFARFLSPAWWQVAAIVGALAAAIALGWMLVNAYGRRSRRVIAIAGALLVLSVAGGVVSTFGFLAYGISGDVRAVVVARSGTLRSIPTEADTAQKTAALPGGSMAVVDQTFLGWVRLAFGNGQTGWVRQEEVVAIWK
jgi:hypothetical protein